MAQDMAELATALFGRSRLETHVSDGSQTSTVYGKATSDSDGGKVKVVLGDAETADGGTNAVELATTTSVKSGDNVIVTLVGGEVGKHPIVTGVVGRGDEQQAQIAQAMEKAGAGGTRVFMEQPTPPYSKGDLWAMAPTTAEGDYADAGAPTIAEHEQAGATYGDMEAYEGRTMLVCTHDRAKGESFDKGDWTVSLELNGHYATHSDLSRTESEIRSEVGDELKVLRGDVEAEAVARKSAIDQKADEITASVAESYATKDALSGEVASRESIVRQTSNGVEVAKKVNGAYTGTKAVIDDDSFDIQGQDGSVYSSFGASKVELGKDSAAAVIELCNGNGRISTADTWTSIESPKTGNLELKSGVGTEQQAFVRVSGGDRPQISLARTDGIADADSVIQMSGSGITIDGGERGVTTGRIKLGNGSMLKAVYIGTWIGKMSAGGDATIISAADAKRYGATNHNAVFLPMNGDTDVGYEIQLTGWQAHDGSFGVRSNVPNRTIRVNWLLAVGA